MNEIIKKRIPINKHIIAVVCFLLIIAAMLLIVFVEDKKPDSASEKVIREIAAKQLGKDPNELGDEDFAQITELSVEKKLKIPGFTIIHYEIIKLSDIKLLSKFTNLKDLSFICVKVPGSPEPAWRIFLKKLHVIKSVPVSEQIIYAEPHINFQGIPIRGSYDFTGSGKLDLSPLKELTKLETIHIDSTPLKSIKPLENLINLRKIYLVGTLLTDFGTLKNLTNLEEIDLYRTAITNLDMIKNLKKLKKLDIQECINITDKQVDDLQKALPNLEIVR